MKLSAYNFNLFQNVALWLTTLVLCSCSQEKNTIVHRTYHNVTARYNGYFNGRLALHDAHRKMNESYEEDYTQLLPIFIHSKNEVVQPIFPDLERAIEKTSLVVDRHSMDINGKENCKWIDDTWIIMGEANYLKDDLVQAKQIFDFTKRKYPDPAIEQLSRYGLARIHTKQGEYTRAGDELRKLENGTGFPEKRLGELHAFMADYFLQQKRTDEAIEQMEKSIEFTHNRDEKTRRMFILAQLLRLQGDGNHSSQVYEQIIKRNPDYEMAFYAKINRALAFDVNKGDVSAIRKTLFKMLKDDKNIEYQDHIYYALAELELKEGDEAEGIEYLTLATKNSVKNGNTKGLAFYRLGEIFFERKNYQAAQSYYDSTVAFLSPEHAEYDHILAMASNLTRLMRDIEVIELQDSLQLFAQKPAKEQERLIDLMIEDLIQAEQDAERERELEESRAQANKFSQNNTSNRNITKGAWYFYNPASVGFGAGEFKKIWGNRKNEDNWRRKNKTSVAPLLVASADGAEIENDTTEGADDPKNPYFYKKNIPDSEEKLATSNALIIEALYDLGLVYKDKMNDEPMCVETFEELISRYDSSKYHSNVYYQLYRVFTKNRNSNKANYYKDLILTEYPETDYAKVILNPNYAEESVNENQLTEEIYQRAYTYFQQGFYAKVYNMCEKAIAEFGNHELKPQFMFLRALSLGKVDSEKRMVTELEEIAKIYGSKPVGKEAREILNYYKNGKTIKTLEENEEEATAEENKKLKASYKYDIGAQHNFIMIVPDTIDLSAAQNKVSDFNRKYFGTKGLKTSYIPLKDGKGMIVVSKIGYVNPAVTYYNTFTNAKLDTEVFQKRGYPYFVISFDNYARFFKNPVVNPYREFFSETYPLSE